MHFIENKIIGIGRYLQTKRQFEKVREVELIDGQIQEIRDGKPLSMIIMEQQQEIDKLKAWNDKLYDIKERYEMEVSAKDALFQKLQNARVEIASLKLALESAKKALLSGNCGHDEALGKQGLKED